MGFNLGNKVSQWGNDIARVGKKVLGETSRIGHKIASKGGSALNTIERVPVLGTALAPATGVIRSGLGLVQNVADLASTGETLLSGAEKVVRSGAEAIKTGDTLAGITALREGQKLAKGSKSDLERAKKVVTDAGALGRQSGSAFKQSARDLRGGVIGAVKGSLTDP